MHSAVMGQKIILTFGPQRSINALHRDWVEDGQSENAWYPIIKTQAWATEPQNGTEQTTTVVF